uniref:Uncharacterized protein n=1 Tax=Candidatus Kentrum sp. DK TaxID=2126562 RepID=A0A450SWR0_9GAMM|nr:MAG: hypothetical protein BECKDK2373B_GA0170837_10732 [Candidatus Kentron sp. DK]
MSICTEICEKSRRREHLLRTYILLAGKVVIFIFIPIQYTREIIIASLSHDFGIDTIVSGAIIILIGSALFVLLSGYLADMLGTSLFEKINSDREYRKKILGSELFIEGRWFIATIEGRNIIEYALADISYKNGRLVLHGDLYIIEDGVASSFGNYSSEVGEFLTEERIYRYGYKRISRIEREDEKYSSMEGKSYGMGVYQFRSDGSRYSRLFGEYSDPISDSLMELRGINVEYLMPELTEKQLYSEEKLVAELHKEFMKKNPFLEFNNRWNA